MSTDQDAAMLEFFADPYPLYRFLRGGGEPLVWHPEWQTWLVFSYTTAVSILRDPRFSVRRFNPDRLPPDSAEPTRAIFKVFDTGMLSSDPPNHTRLRGLVSKAFTPRVIEAQRESIRSMVNTILDSVLDDGRMEVIHVLAQTVPIYVIAEMLGVPRSDRADFKRWSDDAITLLDGMTTHEQDQTIVNSLIELSDYFHARVAHLRDHPADNLLTALALPCDGDVLTEDELVSNALLLLAAGHETTTNLIGNGLLLLMQYPEQMRLLRENPGLIPTAVEEFLRYESPVQWTDRIAKDALEWEGTPLSAGEHVNLCLAACNRDPEQFPDPDHFDITRQENRHIAFSYGAHFCLGAALARLEGQVVFETLLRRLSHIEMETNTPEWAQSFTFRRLNTLPVAFTPA